MSNVNREQASVDMSPDRRREHSRRRQMRRFRSHAVRWIYRAARVPRGVVWHPRRLASALYEQIITSDHVEINRRRHALTPEDREAVQVAGRYGGAMKRATFIRWGDGEMQLHAIRQLVVADPSDDRMFAWGLGALAVRILHDRFWAGLAGCTGTPLEKMYDTECVIADELIHMWTGGEPFADAKAAQS